MLPASEALFLSAILFSLGVLGVVVRRNIIFVLMSIEIMLNAGGLAFVAAGALHGSVDGQAMFLFILPVAAAEVAVGLAIAVLIHQRYKTLDLWALARAREE
jgi:NADH-quinone oxidoreductase subunit K